jgi:hypothetical protein
VLPPEDPEFARITAEDWAYTLAQQPVCQWSDEELAGKRPPTWAEFCAMLPGVRASGGYMPDGSVAHDIYRHMIRGGLV